MLRLIQFEIIKVFKSIFFQIIMIGLLFFILSYYTYVYINTVRADDIIINLENQIFTQEQQIQELYDVLESNEDGSDRETEQSIETWERFQERDSKLLQAYEEEDWTTIMEMEIEQYEPVVDMLRNDPYQNVYTWPTFFSKETLLAQYKWIRDKEITPVLRIEEFAWKTVYDEVFDDPIAEEMVIENSNKYSSAGVHFLNHVFQMLFSLIGAILFLFLFADVVTKEGLGRNGSIHLLKTQPIHRQKILVSKFMTVIIVSFMTLLITAILSIVLGVIFDSFGDWDYPVLIYGEERTFTYMNIGTYLLQSFGLFFMILLFCYSILFLFSVITKKTLIALGLTLATIFIGIAWSQESVLSSFAPYIPFHYFSVGEVITNELAVTLENFAFSFTNGVILLGVASLGVLVVTYVISFVQSKYSN
ncbi:ABC transporter permease [Ornithinibacillus salinisoli]|uniref:ABC transporter permease n=1 Tax=Ornithinibacillus salinisoli TaxID=1848459 RepID=A0ABW4VXL7_9BACI